MQRADEIIDHVADAVLLEMMNMTPEESAALLAEYGRLLKMQRELKAFDVFDRAQADALLRDAQAFHDSVLQANTAVRQRAASVYLDLDSDSPISAPLLDLAPAARATPLQPLQFAKFAAMKEPSPQSAPQIMITPPDLLTSRQSDDIPLSPLALTMDDIRPPRTPFTSTFSDVPYPAASSPNDGASETEPVRNFPPAANATEPLTTAPQPDAIRPAHLRSTSVPSTPSPMFGSFAVPAGPPTRRPLSPPASPISRLLRRHAVDGNTSDSDATLVDSPMSPSGALPFALPKHKHVRTTSSASSSPAMPALALSSSAPARQALQPRNRNAGCWDAHAVTAAPPTLALSIPAKHQYSHSVSPVSALSSSVADDEMSPEDMPRLGRGRGRATGTAGGIWISGVRIAQRVRQPGRSASVGMFRVPIAPVPLPSARRAALA